MFSWICPQCGKECSSTASACPSCKPAASSLASLAQSVDQFRSELKRVQPQASWERASASTPQVLDIHLSPPEPPLAVRPLDETPALPSWSSLPPTDWSTPTAEPLPPTNTVEEVASILTEPAAWPDLPPDHWSRQPLRQPASAPVSAEPAVSTAAAAPAAPHPSPELAETLKAAALPPLPAEEPQGLPPVLKILAVLLAMAVGIAISTYLFAGRH